MQINVYVTYYYFLGSGLESINQRYTWVVGELYCILLLSGKTKQAQDLVLQQKSSFSLLSQMSILLVPTQTILIHMLFQL